MQKNNVHKNKKVKLLVNQYYKIVVFKNDNQKKNIQYNKKCEKWVYDQY